MDDRDVNVLTTPDGTIILTSYSSSEWVPAVRAGEWIAGRRIPERWLSQRQGLTEEGPLRGWLMRLEDGGRTWSRPVEDVPNNGHAGPSVLNDGRLIYVVVGSPTTTKARPILAWESTDKGDTWEKVGEIPRSKGMPEEVGLGESHLAETSSGHLVVLFRSWGRDWDDQFLYQSHSCDAGRTWSEAQRLPVWGGRPI